VSYTNWTCPTCSYTNGSFDPWCQRCGASDPGVGPGPRQQLPGGGTVHPGVHAYSALNERNQGMPAAPTDQHQYQNEGGNVSFFQVRGGNIGDVVREGAYGPISLSTNPSDFTVSWRGRIQSPILDLRPDLGDSAGLTTSNAKPIWRGMAAGAGAQLLIQLEIEQTAGSFDPALINVWQAERGSPWKPDSLYFLGAPTAITQAILDGQTTVTPASQGGGTGDGRTYTTTLIFDPPSNPIRYWQCFLSIDIMPQAAYTEGGDPEWALVDTAQVDLPRIRYTYTVQ